MDVYELIWQELCQVDENEQLVVHARVTTDAIKGSPVIMPITLERMRAMFGVDRENPKWRELVIHPGDWQEMLLDETFGDRALDVAQMTLFGIRVKR